MKCIRCIFLLQPLFDDRAINDVDSTLWNKTELEARKNRLQVARWKDEDTVNLGKTRVRAQSICG